MPVRNPLLKIRDLLLVSTFFGAPIFSENTTFVEVADRNPLTILTPSLKNQQRKKIILPNGLRAYLISDPEAIQSSAALAVEVGSWHDPEEFPGTAHYCEHALFLGTTNFPEDDGFMKYISSWDGKVNAYTKPDRTVYMFSCNHGGMKEGIKRFGEFFHAPVFSEDSLKRELNAVHQEHMKNLQNDNWLAWFVFKQEQNQKHPNAKFSTGNYETLGRIPRDTLVQWYKKHYSSDQMHLVIYSNEPMSQLTKMADETFGVVPKHDENTSFSYETLLSANQEGHIVFIEPVKDLRRVSITWELPRSIALDTNSKPADLIGYTIANESDNSLIHFLKSEGLAEDIIYDVDVIGTQNHLLNFSIQLTIKGTKQLDVVLGHFYQALNQLKRRGVPNHIYQEYKRQTKLSYEWQSREDAFSYAMHYADAMVDEELDTFPYKNCTIATHNQKQTRKLLELLSPYNALTVVQAPSSLTKQTPDRTEKWMGAQYSVVKVSEQQLIEWDHKEVHPKINVPFPNAFIASSLTLHNDELKNEPEAPQLFMDEEAGKCFVWQDNFYGNPELGISLSVKSPMINESSSSIANTDLYLFFVSQKLAPLTSMGSRGGIYTNFDRKDLSLSINVQGFSEKLSPYYLALLDKLQSALPTKEEFDMAKERLLSIYENRSKNLPVVQGIFLMKSVLTNTEPLATDLYAKLDNTTYRDFLNFCQNLFHESYVECLIGGNFDTKKANSIWTATKAKLVKKCYQEHTIQSKKVLILPDEIQSPLSMTIKTPLQGNSAVLALQTFSPTLNNLATHQILHKAISKSFYDTLRTKQQTGYIAQCVSKEDKRALMYLFFVQSTSHYPYELLARFDLFMEEFSNNMETNISKEKFSHLKNTIISSLSKPPENIPSFLSENFTLAYTYEGNFKRSQELIKVLENKSYEEFIQEAKFTLSRENRKRLSILVNGAPATQTHFNYMSTTREALEKLKN